MSSLNMCKEFICDECNESFDIDLYSTIDANANPELKRNLLNQSFFEYTCPHCGALHKITYPLLYHDDKYKIFIYFNSDSLIYEKYLLFKKHNSNTLQFVYDNFNDQYTWLGVSSERDLISAIRIIEKGLDYKIARLVIQKVTQDWVNSNEDPNYQSTSMIGVDLNKHKSLEIFVMSGENGDEEIKMPFPMDLYNIFYKKYKNKLKGTNEWLFVEEQANKFFNEINKNTPDTSQLVTFATLLDEEGNLMSFPAFIPSYLKVKRNDTVLININNIPSYLSVKKIYKCTRKECPFDEKVNPFIQNVVNEYYLLNGNHVIQNPISKPDLYKIINSYLNNNDCVSESTLRDALLNTNVYIEYEINESMYNETLNKNIDAHYNVGCTTYDEQYSLLNIFLEKEDAVNKKYGLACVSFLEAIKFAIMNCVGISGVIINKNRKLDDELTLSNKTLNAYLSDRIMTNHDLMVKLLNCLTKKEIEYMTFNEKGDAYYLIKYFYNHKISVKEYAKKFNMQYKNVDKLLAYGYECLSKIIQSNYWDFD